MLNEHQEGLRQRETSLKEAGALPRVPQLVLHGAVWGRVEERHRHVEAQGKVGANTLYSVLA